MAKNKASLVDAKKFNQEDVVFTDLAAHAEASYLEYAMSVVKGRAIPSVADGLKPVQRRILFAMKELGLSSDKKPKKSARVVGDVIGKYHPHGDSAVYEAMVRIAQPFSLRYPLVIGEGNFGSRDGDPPAAMRYTEARLAPIAETFLGELDMGTVDWRNNYDNTSQEPCVLPARLPNLLLNGAPGIGVGIATEIPPHNMRETVEACIALIKNPKMTLEQVMSHIQGPDYPTGGQIISPRSEIFKAYQDGKGSVRLRAKYSIENEGQKNWRIVVHELPYYASAQLIMEEMERIFNPKPKEIKGKKIVTAEQERLKRLFTEMVERYNDASDKDTPLRLVFEPKSHKQDPQEMITALLAYTSMEMNCPINLVAVGLDGTPKQKNLLEILSEWCDFRIKTVENRTRFELEKASHRLHILEGRKIILDHIEEVVQIIKNSESSEKAKLALMERFSLSEIQAIDVLEMKLRQIARLELEEIEREIAELKAKIAGLQLLLDDPAELRKQVIKELNKDLKAYGDDRRTVILEAERVVAKAIEEQAISDEPLTVAISSRGYIHAKTGHAHEAESFGSFLEGDTLKILSKAKMSDMLVVLDDAGRSYSFPLSKLPSAKGGQSLSIAALTPGISENKAKYAASFVAQANTKAVLATTKGYGFICKASDMLTALRKGKNIVNLGDAKLIDPSVIPPGADPEQTAFCALSSNNRLLAYRLSEINELPKGKGVALIGLDKDCSLSQIQVLKNNELWLNISGKLKKMDDSEFASHVQSRSSSKKGKPVDAPKTAKIDLAGPPPSDEAPSGDS